ncbi:MAG TPA: hypothetical protein VLJ59_08585, partial [Mycobacteriales bacterium]|nr:hypothetical protein [Mycobacteriales bacterium]
MRDEQDVRQMLHNIRGQLAVQRFGGDRLRFRHFDLVYGLMALDVSGHSNPVNTILRHLRDQHRPSAERRQRPQGFGHSQLVRPRAAVGRVGLRAAQRLPWAWLVNPMMRRVAMAVLRRV